MKLKLLKMLRWRNRMIITALVLLSVVGSGVMLLINHFREQMFHRYMMELIIPMESLLDNQIKHMMKNHKPDHFQTLLKEMKVSSEFRWVNVLDLDYKIVFSNDTANIGKYRPPPEYVIQSIQEGDSVLIYTTNDSLPLIRVLASVYNNPQCYECHDPANKQNGFIEIGGAEYNGAQCRNDATEIRFSHFFNFYCIAVGNHISCSPPLLPESF